MREQPKDSIRWFRVAGAGLVAEIAPLLVLVVVASVYGALAAGVTEADIAHFAERAGDWIGPLVGAATTFVCARWAASGTTRPIAHGVLVATLVTILGCAVLVAFGAGFRVIFVVSYATKLVAGWLGGRAARRRMTGPPSRNSSTTHAPVAGAAA